MIAENPLSQQHRSNQGIIAFRFRDDATSSASGHARALFANEIWAALGH
jgi:hypothetical protein